MPNHNISIYKDQENIEILQEEPENTKENTKLTREQKKYGKILVEAFHRRKVNAENKSQNLIMTSENMQNRFNQKIIEMTEQEQKHDEINKQKRIVRSENVRDIFAGGAPLEEGVLTKAHSKILNQKLAEIKDKIQELENDPDKNKQELNFLKFDKQKIEKALAIKVNRDEASKFYKTPSNEAIRSRLINWFETAELGKDTADEGLILRGGEGTLNKAALDRLLKIATEYKRSPVKKSEILEVDHTKFKEICKENFDRLNIDVDPNNFTEIENRFVNLILESEIYITHATTDDAIKNIKRESVKPDGGIGTSYLLRSRQNLEQHGIEFNKDNTESPDIVKVGTDGNIFFAVGLTEPPLKDRSRFGERIFNIPTSGIEGLKHASASLFDPAVPTIPTTEKHLTKIHSISDTSVQILEERSHNIKDYESIHTFDGKGFKKVQEHKEAKAAGNEDYETYANRIADSKFHEYVYEVGDKGEKLKKVIAYALIRDLRLLQNATERKIVIPEVRTKTNDEEVGEEEAGEINLTGANNDSKDDYKSILENIVNEPDEASRLKMCDALLTGLFRIQVLAPGVVYVPDTLNIQPTTIERR